MILENLMRIIDQLDKPISVWGIQVLPVYVATFLLSFLLVRAILVRISGSLGATALLLLPGVFLHELAHFVVAFITNAKPTNFSLIPKRVQDGFVLGAVKVQNLTFYNAAPVALAPLMLIAPAIVLPSMIPSSSPLVVAGVFLLQGIIGHSAFPSLQDWKVAFSKPVGLVMYGAMIYSAFFPEKAITVLHSAADILSGPSGPI